MLTHHNWWNSVRDLNSVVDDTDKEVSDEHILKIYPQLREHGELVAAHLGLTQADIQAIEGMAKPDVGANETVHVTRMEEKEKT